MMTMSARGVRAEWGKGKHLAGLVGEEQISKAEELLLLAPAKLLSSLGT